jgi:hypothetical protein
VRKETQKARPKILSVVLYLNQAGSTKTGRACEKKLRRRDRRRRDRIHPTLRTLSKSAQSRIRIMVDEDPRMMSYESILRALSMRAHMINQHSSAFDRSVDPVARLPLLGNLAVANAEYVEFYEKVYLIDRRLMYSHTFRAIRDRALLPLQLRIEHTTRPRSNWPVPDVPDPCTCISEPNDSPTCQFTVRLEPQDRFFEYSDNDSDSD